MTPLPASSSPPFDYVDFEAWCSLAPVCCSGESQSPIDINPYGKESRHDKFRDIRISREYLQLTKGRLINDGHSCKSHNHKSGRNM